VVVLGNDECGHDRCELFKDSKWCFAPAKPLDPRFRGDDLSGASRRVRRWIPAFAGMI
jgi:hypothetical protein